MSAFEVQELKDTSELVEFFKPQSLYLKPLSKLDLINISVALPHLKDPGQSISNWDLMERIKKLISPMQLNSIKVVKSTIEFVRFEADVDNRDIMAKVIYISNMPTRRVRIIIKLDGNSLKIIGFFETFKVRAKEAKADFPTRHDWDSFFRESKNMNEMHPGERPDTVYLGHVPGKWFSDLRKRNPDDATKDLPSEFVIRRCFETFGDIRCIDVPVLDEFRPRMTKTGIRMQPSAHGYGQHLCFEVYVQFVEYISFVRCMDALRNMKLVHLEPSGRTMCTCIKVDFDRTKHLSDKNIRRRRLERERLVEIDEVRRAEELARKLAVIEQAEEQAKAEVEKEKFSRLRQREERRRLKHLQRKRELEAKEMEMRIRKEERKLMVAGRKLESIRLLTEVLHRAQMVKAKEDVLKVEQDLVDTVKGDRDESQRQRDVEQNQRQRLLNKQEKMLRDKVSAGYQSRSERRRDRRQEQLRQRMLVEQRNHELLRQQAVQISSDEEIIDDEEDTLREMAIKSRKAISTAYHRSGASSSKHTERPEHRSGRKSHPRVRAPPPPVVVSSLHHRSKSRHLVNTSYDTDDHQPLPSRLPDIVHSSSPPVKRRFVKAAASSTSSRILVASQSGSNPPSVKIIIEDRRTTSQPTDDADYACYYEHDDMDEYDVLTY